jgi:hypothetical protein
MTDDVTAHKILQDWATSRGFSTTLTVDGSLPGDSLEKKLYFHADTINGFAYINFDKSPQIKMIVSTERFLGAHAAVLQSLIHEGWGEFPDSKFPAKKYDEYDLNLADEKVFIKIERILDRAIDSYGG